MDILNHLNEFIRGFVGYDKETPGALEIVLAMTLSFLLMCLISAVYKKTYRGSDYSQDYVHTLIILGTVVSVVIMVVRGDPGTAFGMFAAFSIIRFRRSVRQSRDIGFIFLAMAAGLGVGARQYGLATITTIIICAVIYGFSTADIFAPKRLSHFLRIQTGMMTELRYNVSLKDETRPGAIVTALQQLNGNNRILLTAAASSLTMGE